MWVLYHCFRVQVLTIFPFYALIHKKRCSSFWFTSIFREVFCAFTNLTKRLTDCFTSLPFKIISNDSNHLPYHCKHNNPHNYIECDLNQSTIHFWLQNFSPVKGIWWTLRTSNCHSVSLNCSQSPLTVRSVEPFFSSFSSEAGYWASAGRDNLHPLLGCL